MPPVWSWNPERHLVHDLMVQPNAAENCAVGQIVERKRLDDGFTIAGHGVECMDVQCRVERQD
jgi:hypothetical protein